MGNRPPRAPIGLSHRARGRIRPAIGGVFALVVLAGACVGNGSSGQELRGSESRQPPNKEFLGGTVAANNAFSSDLYHLVSPNRGNFVSSPYAVFRVLAMVRSGSAATGATRSQLDELLHASLTPDLDSGINTVDSALSSRSGEKVSDTRKGRVTLEFAGSLWIQRGTHIKNDYLSMLARSYGTGVHVVDFRSDAEASRQAINLWGREATEGHFEELVTRGGVTQFTRVLAAAENYLQAPWQMPFDRALTRPAAFQRLDDQPVNVPTMELAAPTGLRFAETADWMAVELPYLGGETSEKNANTTGLSLVIVVPATGQFGKFESDLKADGLKAITAALEPRAVDLRVPLFQFETSGDLADQLQQRIPAVLGQDADLSGISSDEPLSLSEVHAKGFFGINEEGTEAANTATAETGTGPAMVGARTVAVDRPFIFFVRDRETGIILQIGRVVSP